MAQAEQTQVAIIGGGPAGLLLGQLLHTAGIDCIVIERQTRSHVLSRIRAGVLENGFVSLMEQAGVATRLHEQGIIHTGVSLSYGDRHTRIKFADHIDKNVTVYGQTEVTQDLYDARDQHGGTNFFSVEGVSIDNLDSSKPQVNFKQHDKNVVINCDFVAGCDGFHGVSRKTIPDDVRQEFHQEYPFGWMGVLSETAPVHDEVLYSNSEHGFALCSMRSQNLSRYYVQCDATDNVEDWSDDRFWEELKRRLPQDFSNQLQTSASIEKSIAPLRSFVCQPMQWGKLYLCGDAAHIAPPTGAKGLNTAASDVHYLFNALVSYYQDNNEQGLQQYSTTALARVWKTQRFSWWMTNLLHRFPDQSPYERRMQHAEFDYLSSHPTAQANLAINYVGLAY